MNAKEFLLKHSNMDDLVLNERAYPKNTPENMGEWVYASDMMEKYADEKVNEKKVKQVQDAVLKPTNCRKCGKPHNLGIHARELARLCNTCFSMEETKGLDFGDKCAIEQFRYGADNEFYIHKVIGRKKSNSWVEVPAKGEVKEMLHDKCEDVIACICCGVSEREVLNYRPCDVAAI